MPYYQNSFDLEETITQLRVAHEQNAAQLEDVKERIAEESAKAAAALTEAQQVSAEAAAIEATVQREPKPSPKLADDTKGRVVDALDLVFVIDSTASMGPVIADLASSMRASSGCSNAWCHRCASASRPTRTTTFRCLR